MKILVAGGAGFLGSHLCAGLLKGGHEVICLDNFYSGRKSNVENFLDNPNFSLITGDINFPLTFEVEGIFNMACPASPPHYQKDPIYTLKTNIIGSLNLLELAERNGARIFQASTSEIYGDPLENPQNERYWGNVNPIGIRSCYDEGKRGAESLFFDYFRSRSLDIRLARIFNTYGPNMDSNDGRVVSNFIVQALRGQDISIYGDGTQTRSFCYVDDLIEGILKFFFHEGFPGPLNLGNPTPISMNDLAAEVIFLTGSASKVKYEALPTDDPKLRTPDIEKAVSLLDWQPKVERTIGLLKTIEYFSHIKV